MSLLSDLFLDTKDPTYIYNQGRCLEQNGRFSEATLRFQEYLRLGGSKARRGDREDAERHIADCQAQVAKQNPQREHSTATVAGSADVSQPQVAITPPAATTIVEPPARPQMHGGSGVRVAGLATAGLGIAGIITGIVFNIKANGMVDDYGTRGSYTRDKESDRSSYETLGWVGYGVGSACLVTGAVLYLWGRRLGNQTSSRVALFPSFGPVSVGATVRGAF